MGDPTFRWKTWLLVDTHQSDPLSYDFESKVGVTRMWHSKERSLIFRKILWEKSRCSERSWRKTFNLFPCIFSHIGCRWSGKSNLFLGNLWSNSQKYCNLGTFRRTYRWPCDWLYSFKQVSRVLGTTKNSVSIFFTLDTRRILFIGKLTNIAKLLIMMFGMRIVAISKKLIFAIQTS